MLRLVLAILLITAPAWSWGLAGHHIVLMDGKYSIVDISTCADQLRGASRPGEEMCRTLSGPVPPTNGLWHYIDIPVPAKSKALAAFCPEGNCVTAQIQRFSGTLRASNDDAQKRQALLFLVHFLGDIHQPLHAVERACDRGGNAERVNFFLDGAKRPNLTLHSVWDSQEVELLMRNSKITDERAFAASLISSIQPGRAKKWARASADQIAWESYKLAVKNAYPGIPYQDFCDNQKPPPIVTDLTPFYGENGTKIVREQLMKAGVRLAAILESDLGAH